MVFESEEWPRRQESIHGHVISLRMEGHFRVHLYFLTSCQCQKYERAPSSVSSYFLYANIGFSHRLIITSYERSKISLLRSVIMNRLLLFSYLYQFSELYLVSAATAPPLNPLHSAVHCSREPSSDPLRSVSAPSLPQCEYRICSGMAFSNKLIQEAYNLFS